MKNAWPWTSRCIYPDSTGPGADHVPIFDISNRRFGDSLGLETSSLEARKLEGEKCEDVPTKLGKDGCLVIQSDLFGMVK